MVLGDDALAKESSSNPVIIEILLLLNLNRNENGFWSWMLILPSGIPLNSFDNQDLKIYDGCKITVKECWNFNSYLNIPRVLKAVNSTKPDSILFNLQFMKFGDKKIPAAMGLMLPYICKLKGIATIWINRVIRVDVMGVIHIVIMFTCR